MVSNSEPTAQAIFFLIGIGSSLPWNVFITAQDYFQHRLEDTSYAESFLNWFSMAFNMSNLLTMLIRTVFIGNRMPSAVKTVFTSLVVTMVILFSQCLMTRMPEFFGNGFFRITMASIVFVSCAGTLMQEGILRIVSKFPPRFTQAVVTGQAMAGLGVSTSNFFIMYSDVKDSTMWSALKSNPDLCAFTYFVLVFITLICSTLSFVLLTRMKVFRRYQKEDNEPKRVKKYMEGASKTILMDEDSSRETLLSGEEREEEEELAQDLQSDKADPIDVAIKIRFYAIAVFLVFVVTLGLFPGITSTAKSVNPSRGRFFRDLFTPFTLILFNLGDFLSRASSSSWPKMSSKKVMLASLARVIFFPLIMLCNLQNEHHEVITEVVFRNDLFPLLFLIALAFSNGLLATLAFMHYPRLLHTNQEKELGSNIMLFTVSLGLTAGSLMSFVVRAMLRP